MITHIDHLRTLARLRRVNRPLALRDELDALELMPSRLWPWVEVPVLDRETLKQLRAELVAAPGEIEGRHEQGSPSRVAGTEA